MKFDVAIAVQSLKDPRLQSAIEEQLRIAFEPSEVRMPLASALPNEIILVSGMSLRIADRKWHVNEAGVTLVLFAEPQPPAVVSSDARN